MERDYKIYDLRGFCNLQDDCSKCRLDALTDNCDFDELPDNARHLIAVELHYGPSNLDLCHAHSFHVGCAVTVDASTSLRRLLDIKIFCAH